MDFQTFRSLPLKQKTEHIWEYYRWHILIALVVLGLLGTWIVSAFTSREPILDIEMINAYQKTPGGEAFRPFLEQAGVEYYEDAVYVDRNIQFSPGDATPDLGSMQLLMCAMASGEADLYFFDTREIPPALQGGPLMDLRLVLPADVLEARKDQLVYDEDPETGETWPCGIYMERNPWMLETVYYVNCTACVSVSAEDKDLAGQLILWLLSME